MGLLIFLRTNKDISYFRRELLGLINSPASNKLLLCSGYISEGRRRRKQNYSVLNDGLLVAINSQCKEVITVRGMYSNKKAYDLFVKKLRNSGVKVTPRKVKKGKWHAKVAIKVDKNNRPVAGLIGSSNLTRPAYGENYNGFNCEADVLIWENTSTYNQYFREGIKNFIEDPLGPVDTILNPDTEQPDESKKLEGIYNKIMRESEEEWVE
ncbi:MAG: hypothetical protein L6408_09200 [Nanoarchaeota archaeon]|nr:hypothetical protein [Nanoarchaeota archaeon]